MTARNIEAPRRLTRDDLRKKFEALLHLERQARDLYAGYAKRVSDPEIRKRFLLIRDQEAMHMKAAERLIALVKTPSKPKRRT